MPFLNQAKPTASVNPAAPQPQETFRDSRLSAEKEVQPLAEMLWGGRQRESGERKRKRKKNWEGCYKLKHAASSREVRT